MACQMHSPFVFLCFLPYNHRYRTNSAISLCAGGAWKPAFLSQPSFTYDLAHILLRHRSERLFLLAELESTRGGAAMLLNIIVMAGRAIIHRDRRAEKCQSNSISEDPRSGRNYGWLFWYLPEFHFLYRLFHHK